VANNLSNLNDTSARHRVRSGVEQMILRGEFQSGTKLKQVRLAEHFGVGQGVVREALLELQSMGLVETIDNRGIYVTQLNGKKLIDAIEVRAAIEGMAIRLYTTHSTDDERSKLRRSADLIFQLSSAGIYEEAASLDREFHLELVRLSGNDELVRLTKGYRAFGKIVQMRRSPQAVLEDHMAILDAVEKRDAETAERMMRSHIEVAKTWLNEQIDADPNFIPRWVV
jgi:DNA-binding GntR family transcriptional regulator